MAIDIFYCHRRTWKSRKTRLNIFLINFHPPQLILNHFVLLFENFVEVISHYWDNCTGTDLITMRLRGKAFKMAVVIGEFHRDVWEAALTLSMKILGKVLPRIINYINVHNSPIYSAI